MAFPGKITSGQDLTPQLLQKLRQALVDRVSTTTAIKEEIPQQLAQIAQILGRSAGNEPTVYDNGTVRTTATGSANLMTQQVERALTQVLGRAPGREPSSFISALNSAFPVAKNGQVVTMPTRSVVSLYSPDSNGSLLAGTQGNAQLSVEQANLYRQASIIAADALRVLDGLTPFEPTADLDAVEALRSLVRAQIQALVEEFGRLDEPRKERVETYLNTLLVTDRSGNVINGFLKKMGEQARLVQGEGDGDDVIVPVTVDDETQVAGYELLINYVQTLKDIWKRYDTPTVEEQQATIGRYSERLSRANILLPVIADSNASFMSAMDSIGFTESERRSDTALFTTLGFPNFVLEFALLDNPAGVLNTVRAEVSLPHITMNDFNDWVDRFTTIEAPSILATAGNFGLDFVTDQADTLFWVVGLVLYYVRVNPLQNPGLNGSLLARVLSFERVQQSLSELVAQLDTLADRGVATVSPRL